MATLVSSFGCNSLFSLLRDPKALKPKIVMIIEKCFTTLRATPSTAIKDVPTEVIDAVFEIEDLCLAVLCLASPPYVEHVAKVHSMMKYTGKNPTCCLLRDVLKQETWAKMLSEVLSKGAASVSALPEIQKLEKAVANISDEEVFVEAVSKLANFRKSTRTGLVDHLEKAIVDAGLLIAEKLLVADSVSCSMSYVDAVVEVMSLIPDRPTSLQLINKLNKVKVKASSTLAMNELFRVLSCVDAIESESHGEWKEKVVPFLASFLQSIKICKDSPFPNETVTNLLHGFVGSAYQCIFSLYRAPRILSLKSFSFDDLDVSANVCHPIRHRTN